MPVNIKFVAFFRGIQGYGWSEVHYKQSSSDNPNLKVQLDNYYHNVLNARSLLLGSGCAIVGARASYPRAGVIASYPRKEFLNGNEEQKSSAPALSLACQFVDSTYTRSKIVHLRGFWDSVESDEAYFPTGPGTEGWLDRIAGWKAALVGGGYGWPTKDNAVSAKGVVTTYTVKPDGHVELTLEAPGITVVPEKSLIVVRFSRINKSQSILNRALLVEVTSPTKLTTIKQVGAGPFTDKGRYNYRGTGFTGYADMGAITLGKRAMGKPIYRTPSRSSAIQLY